MKTALGAALALLAAPAAVADEFCDDLKVVLAAGGELPAPYDSLVDPAKKMYNGKLSSIAPAKLVRGLPEGAVCRRYIAGLADGVVGGGTHNQIECDLGHAQAAAEAELNTKRTAVIAQVSACLTPSGWTGGTVERVPGGGALQIERATFKPQSGMADIVIEREERIPRSRGAGSVRAGSSYSLKLQIRTPTLAPPKPAG